MNRRHEAHRHTDRDNITSPGDTTLTDTHIKQNITRRDRAHTQTDKRRSPGDTGSQTHRHRQQNITKRYRDHRHTN